MVWVLFTRPNSIRLSPNPSKCRTIQFNPSWIFNRTEMRWSTPQPWSTWIAQLLKAHTRVIKDTCQTCKLSPKATTFTREIQLLNKTVDSLVKSLPSTGIQEPKYTSKTPSSFSQLSCPSCMLQCAHQKLPQLL